MPARHISAIPPGATAKESANRRIAVSFSDDDGYDRAGSDHEQGANKDIGNKALGSQQFIPVKHGSNIDANAHLGKSHDGGRNRRNRTPECGIKAVREDGP